MPGITLGRRWRGLAAYYWCGMALQISQYIDPGVIVQEVIVPGALNIASVPVLPTIVAEGSRVKTITNEAVVRGLVETEALTVATPAPHNATLANRGDRKVANTTVRADGVALADQFVSYTAASVIGTVAGTFALVAGTNDAISIELDGNTPVTLVFTAGAGATTVVGTEVTVGESTIAALATASRAEIAAAINEGLNPTDSTANAAMVALGYGVAYNAVASDATTGVQVTSPITTPSSDVRLFDPIVQTAMTTIFGAATLDAPTELQISATVFDATAAYTADYVAIADFSDAVANTATLSAFTRVGSFAGTSTFTLNTDFANTSGSLDWSNASATGVITNATTNGIAGTGTTPPNYDVSTNDVIRLSLDGRAALDIDLNALASPPLGYANPGTPGDATAAEIAANINAVLGNSTVYGPRYQDVADTTTVGGNVVLRLTSPNDGTSSDIAILHPTATDATTEIFGLAASQTLTVMGAGTRPTSGSVYFASYTFTRPAADYNNPQQFFTPDQAFGFTGPLSATNPLAIGVDIAFKNGAPTVLLVQIDDTFTPGSPTRNETQLALDAAATKSTATDICILTTNLAIQTDLMQHVEGQSSPTEKNFRRGWFGMARGTAIGDIDTPDSYVFRAKRTLQVAADSPARGRLILVSSPGPEGISKTIVEPSGATSKLNLDSSYLALAIASRMASFLSPAEALARKTITGFDIAETDFTAWVRGERATLASSGVTVVTFDAGRFILLDPTTTERGGGGLISFEQISASTQKDNITRKVTQALDANIIGIVPTDLADFILDIKLFINNVLLGEIGSGAIGPFRDANGNARAIDLNRDIIVEQDPNDPTQFNFKFFFNLRYPALRLLGEFSVDNPFFERVA